MNKILDDARNVFNIEIDGIRQVMNQLDGEFIKLVQTCLDIFANGGKIVVSGVGKSGHIGQKISATLASTGSPSVFMHPVEALHGDLGILQKKDLLLALSYSGETDELLAILPSAKRIGVPVASITGDCSSELAEISDITVEMAVNREACPFNLAPTTTAAALLTTGDALAVVLLRQKGFTKEDYGRLHPGGAIGRSVTMKVSDIMRTDERLAIVNKDELIKNILVKMTGARSGSAIVVDDNMQLLGIFTDGDFRRHIDKSTEVLELPVGKIMTKNPASIKADALAVEILKLVEKKHIDDIIALDKDEKVVGLVDIQDLPGLKLL